MNPFRKYLLIALVLALVNAVLILVFFFPRYNHTDTPQYFSAIKNIIGDKTAELSPYRMLKPMPILIGVLLTNFTAVENTLIIQNILFYFLFVVLVYFLVYRIYQNEKQACYGAVLGMTAYPILAYGLASLTDMSGWFFFLVSVLLSLEFLKNPNFKMVVLAGLLSGFGMLFKESVAAAPIFFISLVFIASHFPFREKIKYILVFGLVFLFFPLINGLIFYHLFSYSSLDTFRAVGVGGEGLESSYMYTFSRIIIEIGRVFLMGWIFVLLGIQKEFAPQENRRNRTLLSFIPSSLSGFLWISPHNRILFIGFPILVLLGSFGVLRRLTDSRVNLLVELGLLLFYVVINYALLELLLNYGIYFQSFGDLTR